jgi:acetylornithine deacetylase/succinyl-diaminopimelate desuccinylase-like protein
MRGLRKSHLVFLVLLVTGSACAQDDRPMPQRARHYLGELIRLDTTNPPGNETRVAEYLKQVTMSCGIPSELLGDDPARLNFVARLRGSGKKRPLLLMAHSDVVPADRSQWTVDPFGAEIREGYLYGRGAQDDKSLLAAELAVFTELKRRNVNLDRDVILLAESDEEAGSTGIQWMIKNAYDRIDAEFALNEGGTAQDTHCGIRLFQIQTAEKIPTRVKLTARGTAGHASLPRPDNPVVRLAWAITRLAEANQPVRLNATTRRFFKGLASVPDYARLAPLLPRLENSPSEAVNAANAIRAISPELSAMLRTTVSPTMLQAGTKINVIPNVAEAQVDVRRLPNETKEEVMARLRRIVNDNEVEIVPAGGQEMPATAPSSTTTELYQAMERVFLKSTPRGLVVPLMSKGATDGAFLRARGMTVYGLPLCVWASKDIRMHGNDERIPVHNLEAGTKVLEQIVLAVAGKK